MAGGLLDFLQGASNSVASNVTAPVDGIAWLMRKAGLPIPDAPIGGSDWAAQKGVTRPAHGVGGLLGEVAGSVAPVVVAAKAPQIAKGLLQMEANAMAPSTLNRQAGMIMMPFGVIPENADDLASLAGKKWFEPVEGMTKRVIYLFPSY